MRRHDERDLLSKGALKGEDHSLRSADYPTERAERRMDQEGGDLAQLQFLEVEGQG